MSNVAPASAPHATRLMRDAIILMTQHKWQPKIQLQDMTQFEKLKRPETGTSGILILALPIIGLILVLIWIGRAGKELVTFQVEDGDELSATSSKGKFTVVDQSHLRQIAEMVPSNGASYVGAILLGIISVLLWYMLLPLFIR
jgi:hypothetical protein